MTDAATYEALAARCEAAKGGDRELDAAIVLSIGWSAPEKSGSCGPTFARRELYEWHDENGVARGFYPPRITGSIDAAMIVIEGHGMLMHLSEIGAEGLPLAQVICPHLAEAPVFVGIVSRIMANTSVVAGLALALAAASLRARAASVGGE